MKLQWRNVVGAVMLVGVTAVATEQVVSQQDPPSEAEMMEMWAKLATPGDQHKLLTQAEGTWDYEMSHWMVPGGPPSKSKGENKIESIMGGRFTLHRVQGEMDMGAGPQPFEGLGIYGFDNAKQKHVQAWVDNLGTLIMMGEGTADAAGNITYYSEMDMGGMVMKMKSVSSMPNKDRGVLEMYSENPEDGSWIKSMEVVSTRRR